MGKVYRAFDPSLNRTVAIKILAQELADDPKFVEDFLREAQNAAAISHPHIVQIYFVGSENNQYFLAMELLNGNPLSRLLEEAGPLPEGRVLKIGIEAVEALRTAYDRHMIHGDIKPQNLFITDSAGVKLCDFGLAKLANVEAPQTDEVWGSAYYIAPERIQRKSEDFRSDVYSLGAMMFEALTGQPPYRPRPRRKWFRCTSTNQSRRCVPSNPRSASTLRKSSPRCSINPRCCAIRTTAISSAICAMRRRRSRRMRPSPASCAARQRFQPRPHPTCR